MRSFVEALFNPRSKTALCAFALLVTLAHPANAFGSIPWKGDGADNSTIQQAGEEIIAAICTLRGLTLALNSGQISSEEANSRLNSARLQYGSALDSIATALELYNGEQTIFGDDSLGEILEGAWSEFIELSDAENREQVSTLKELYELMNEALNERWQEIQEVEYLPIGSTEAWVSNVGSTVLLDRVSSDSSRLVFSVTVIEMPIAREFGLQ